MKESDNRVLVSCGLLVTVASLCLCATTLAMFAFFALQAAGLQAGGLQAGG